MPTTADIWVPWEVAWRDALYGRRGFYRRPEGPAGHFRTASHTAPGTLARALAGLARKAGCTAIADVGAGRGELVTALAGLPEPPHLLGVDVIDRPAALPAAVGWTRDADRLERGSLAGTLVVAWELLDTVPCPVLEVDADGVPRTVLVQTGTGRERRGGPAHEEDLAWCRRWWPLDDAPEEARAEVGRPREHMWSRLVAAASPSGLLLAVDYTHTLATRPAAGTLSGYRRGRLVPPVPDGSCDVTAHVAIDAVEAAGRAAGAMTGVLVSQHGALRALGVHAGEPGGVDLLDPAGLGGFTWLLQAVGGNTWSPG